MDGAGASVFRLGDWTLDVGAGTLKAGDRHAPLRAKSFAVLAHLARNAGRVVPKDELLDVVWPDVTVTEDSLIQCVADLRRTLGPCAAALRTVPRRGYLLDAPAAVPRTAATPAAPTALPRLAVTPFATTGLGPEDAALVEGLAEEVAHALVRFRMFEVIAPRAGAEARAGDAAFFVEGSARRTPAGLRLSVALATSDGRRLWGEGYGLGGDDLIDALEDIPRRIVARLVPTIEAAVLAASSAPASASAFTCFVRGLALFRSYAEGANQAAEAEFRRALALDPGYALARAYAALAKAVEEECEAAPPDVLAAARAEAEQAVNLAPEEARCWRALGHLRAFAGVYAGAEQALRRCLALNPYDPDSLAQLGFIVAIRGRAEEGLALIDRAIAVNPLHPLWYAGDRFHPLFLLGRHQEAIDTVAGLPRMTAMRLTRIAACRAALGDLAGAAAALAEARTLRPDWDPLREARRALYERAEDMRRLLSLVEAAIAAERVSGGR